ncbi:MAG: RNA-binding protein [candidate division KSB1 bacterium]|nr:RNA-binding protein [candidate division KSB1 bacterium]
MNLYVGNLSYDVVQTDLEKLFGAIGTVKSAKVIRDQSSGESRGFGFVEMESVEEGKKAIEELNGKEVKGRAIVVNEARPRREDNRGGRQSGGYGSSSYRSGNRSGGYRR